MSEELLLLADQRARAQAIDPRRSILLEAPAGSGKTTVLTQRFLKLLCTVDDPTAILAITFTRKAAAEMRGRVVGALRGELAADDPSAPELAELARDALRHGAARGWNLAADPAALRIQTIDSFNYWLASQLPLAARAGGALTVTESPEGLYRAAARRTLSALDGDPLLAADAEILFERLDNQWRTFEWLLAQLLAQRGHWLRYVLQDEPESLCARVRSSLTDLVRSQLTRLEAALPQALRRAAEGLPGVGTLSSEPSSLPAWKRLAALALTHESWRRVLQARHLGPEYESRAAREGLSRLIGEFSRLTGLEERLRAVAAIPRATLAAAESRALAALSGVLKRAAIELQLEFAESRRVDYTAITGAAREALTDLGEPTDLALRTGLALRHILVDEFQDTSLAQFDLLERLTAGWEETEGRTLFVVGDAMQSIYRFRDAEVGLFIAARERGIGRVKLAPLRLARNFRAAAPLVAWTNATFAQLFPASDDLRSGAVAFSASVAARAPRGSAGPAEDAVLLRIYPGDPLAEARAIAERIAELRRVEPQSSIAVLVAAHSHATPLLDALNAQRVEWLGVDLLPLAERPVVRDLVQLARALYDLADRSAWLAILRAPYCGARLTTLTALSSPEPSPLILEALADRRRLAACAPDDVPRITRVREVLTVALAQRDREPVADWLERTWAQLGASDAYPKGDLEDARAFLAALAGRAAEGSWSAPEDFPALLENLHSAPLAMAGTTGVQIMTIHRAKGLEFDHVFVPALERALAPGERSLLHWTDLAREDGGSDLLMAPEPAAGEKSAECLSGLIQTLNAKRVLHERTRLIYVAATRARQTLQLSAALKPRTDGEWRADRESLLGSLWPVLGEHFRIETAAASRAADEARRPPQLLRRLAPVWERLELAPRGTPLPHLPLARAALEPPEFKWVRATQREVGTIVHAYLRELAERDPLPSGTALGREHAALLRRLERAGVPEREWGEAANLIVSALERTLGDARGRWILKSTHREASSELALTGIAAGSLRSVVIDRSFVDEEGTRWVIDYKTSRHEGGGLEEFLATELERYRPQLSTYQALAHELGPEPVRAALYFPLLGAFREL